MNKASLALLWLFVLSSSVYADSAAKEGTPEEAHSAVVFATTTLDQAVAWESLSRKSLDTAKQALAKKPKSVAAKRAVTEAQKEFDSAVAYKAMAEAKLQEELLEKSAVEKAASEKQTYTTNNVTVYPQEKYRTFTDEYESAERIDPYYFFNDPLDYKNKSVILDAKFVGMISPGEAKFMIRRNFGKMNVIVSNAPSEDVIPKDKTMLLAGVITGFKKEVVSGELLVITLLKLDGVFICSDTRCRN